ncbi:MAG TPA: hypothetical protein VMR43_00695 [Variovorax sp.]|nr:hypothetical protein [Variovorax sp.]
MLATRIQYAFVGAALVMGGGGFAQTTDPAQAQRRYEARIAE